MISKLKQYIRQYIDPDVRSGTELTGRGERKNTLTFRLNARLTSTIVEYSDTYYVIRTSGYTEIDSATSFNELVYLLTNVYPYHIIPFKTDSYYIDNHYRLWLVTNRQSDTLTLKGLENQVITGTIATNKVEGFEYVNISDSCCLQSCTRLIYN